MRPMLIAPCALALILAACGFQLYDPTWMRDCDGKAVQVDDDVENCGACDVVCVDVACVKGECQYNTPLHCGEAYRTCIGYPDRDGVECVAVTGTDADPPHGEAVNGYACTPAPPLDDAGVGDGGVADDEGEGGAEGASKAGRPAWVLIPGHTDTCHRGLDHRLCQTAAVDVDDVCGQSLTLALDYDFEIMTTELSRGQYRRALCDCAAPETALCIDLCADDAEAEARPVTGLNWCEAYLACQAYGARLPTVLERARLEAVADVPRALFRQAASCTAFTREAGNTPWLAECLGDPDVGLDRVDGDHGVVLFGTDVLPEPRRVHHLVGNVDEWLADPAAAFVYARLVAGERWGVTTTLEEQLGPRLVRGRSVFSPAGQSGDRLIAVDPSVKAGDVGVRCARTARSPHDEPMPYDEQASPYWYARCDAEATGLRPVRRTSGEQVFQATAMCIEIDAPPSVIGLFEHVALFGVTGTTVALARRLDGDRELAGVGQARFSVDEQWWLAEPARAEGDRLTFVDSDGPIRLTWLGENEDVTSRCRRALGAEVTNGQAPIRRRHTFGLDRVELLHAVGDHEVALQAACAHLTCLDALAPEQTCEDHCQLWALPVALDFRRVEPYTRGELCHLPPSHPAER